MIVPVWFWIIMGVILLGLLSGSRGNRGKTAPSGKPFRIDHPHYMSEDECECSVCGARFKEKVMECPACGARFGTATESQDEWYEEFDEACDMDEEEEEK